jgi:hypothetical protein
MQYSRATSATSNHFHVVIIGAGPAGFFAAIVLRELVKECSCTILEAQEAPLLKLRGSGGGRANITNACFEARKLIENYPRGGKELLGPFTRFGVRETVSWFESHKIALKTEPDGRIFPASNTSQTIVDLFLERAKSLGVQVQMKKNVTRIQKNDHFLLSCADTSVIECDRVLVATGGSRSINTLLAAFGHTIEPQIPSLFAFSVPTSALLDLSGITVEKVRLEMFDYETCGSLLLTHFGFAGPAILKLSSFAARELFDAGYRAPLSINWLPDLTEAEIKEVLLEMRAARGQKIVCANCPFDLPQNLWKRLVALLSIPQYTRFTGLSGEKIAALARKLSHDKYEVEGKTTHKQEFVTCGGVRLDEVNFKTMESKLCRGLYFAGEVLNIDAITGGFNLQNCWTTAWIAASALGDISNALLPHKK